MGASVRAAGICLACGLVAILAIAGVAVSTSPRAAKPQDRSALERTVAPIRRHFPEDALVGILSSREEDHVDNVSVRYLLQPRQMPYVTADVRPEWAIGLGDARNKAESLEYDVVGEWEGGVLLLHRRDD